MWGETCLNQGGVCVCVCVCFFWATPACCTLTLAAALSPVAESPPLVPSAARPDLRRSPKPSPLGAESGAFAVPAAAVTEGENAGKVALRTDDGTVSFKSEQIALW